MHEVADIGVDHVSLLALCLSVRQSLNRAARPPHSAERLRLSEVGFYLFHEAPPHESEAQPPVSGRDSAVRQSLTALCGGRAATIIHPLRRTACALGLLSLPTGSRFRISFALKSTQRIRLRGSTNTEPVADRGPQTGSPAGVVVATGPNVQYTKRSMREFRDEHRDIHNRLSCKGICNQTSSRSLSLPVPYLCGRTQIRFHASR